MNTAILNTPLGLVIKNDAQKDFPTILNEGAMDFIIALHEKFNHKRLSILQKRVMSADLKSKSQSHAEVHSSWVASNIPTELLDVSSSVKISAGSLFDANFSSKSIKQTIVKLEGKNYEENCREHQAIFNYLRNRAIDSSIFFEPRPLATEETNLSIHDSKASAALYDFGLYFFNNAYELVHMDKNPCFTISRIYSSEDAKWWNDVFVFAQSYLGLPSGTIRVQVDLGAVPAIKNIDTILFELKQHLAMTSFDLRAYLESHVKTYFQTARMTMPNLDQLSVASPFLADVLDYIVHISHKIGIPCIVDTHISNERTRSFQPDFKYIFDKGFDGTAIIDQEEASLVNTLMIAENNQLSNKRFDVSTTAINLERTPTGTITEHGVAQCLASFRKSIGSFDQLMADESLEGLILKQWINHECTTVSGKTIDLNYCLSIRQ